MDACRSRGLRASLSVCLVFVMLPGVVGCDALTALTTLSSQVDNTQTNDPVDLTSNGGVCDTNFVADYAPLGLDLPSNASAAPGFTPDAEAVFSMAWVFSVGDVTITLDAEATTVPFPSDLSLIVEAANEAVTLAGGNVNAPIDLVLANGDAATLTTYSQDGVFYYRVNTLKSDTSYVVTASVPQDDLTQNVDNAMVSAVTSLCVD